MSTQESCCSPRAFWGWSPQPSPADTRAKRLADRLLPGTGVALVVFFALIVLLFLVAPLFPRPTELALDGVAFVAGAWWCGVNFWRSRHAHCVVTATGWSALALLTFFEAQQDRSFIAGDEQLVFLAVLAIGLAFEAAWFRVRGTNALRIRPPAAP